MPQRYALVSSRQRARGAPGGGREIEWPAAWVDAMRWAFAYMSLSSSPASSIPRSPAPPVVNSTATAALVRYDVEAVVRCSVGLDYSFRLGHARRRMARRDRSAARDAADGSVVAVEAGVVDEGDGFSFRMAQHEGSREAPWWPWRAGLRRSGARRSGLVRSFVAFSETKRLWAWYRWPSPWRWYTVEHRVAGGQAFGLWVKEISCIRPAEGPHGECALVSSSCEPGSRLSPVQLPNLQPLSS